MMGELRFFLGLQIKQQEDSIFFQEKYIRDLLKKYKRNEAKIMSTPMHPSSRLDKDEQAYCDVDYAGDKIERKSTSGACQFLVALRYYGLKINWKITQ